MLASWLVCVLVAGVAVPMTEARVDFLCVFGDILSTPDAHGQLVSFCPTKMDPPFMSQGDFIWASHHGRCFECVCEQDLGLACCECPRRRG